VGTGFHPELTGRENVFLNGAVLGMKRTEIAAKFDEIVAFAEIDRFLDTPVKHYSSGMYMRLAFAVAAHLEPEVLLVDEVLAVGDKQFQAKCLGKIKAVAGHGRTVVFVSHNMQAIRQLCSRALWLRAGSVIADGHAFDVTETYLQDTPSAESAEDLDSIIRQLPPDPAFRLKAITLTQGGQHVQRVLSGRPLEITVSYEVLARTTGMRVFFDICENHGELLFRSFHDEDNDGIPTVEPGEYVSRATIPADVLAPIRYELRVHAGIYDVRMCTPGEGVRLPLEVEATGRTNRAYVLDAVHGKLALSIPWTTTKAGP
jgi:lipopolysaccharide transport system ATP-binding protein